MGIQPDAVSPATAKKQLRRLPHVFSKVLELPLSADADVAVRDDPDAFRFIAANSGAAHFRAHTVRIHPGVVKIVVRPVTGEAEDVLDEMELDRWRFRLPPETKPEMASVSYVKGWLVVKVPKVTGADKSGKDRREKETRKECNGGALRDSMHNALTLQGNLIIYSALIGGFTQ